MVDLELKGGVNVEWTLGVNKISHLDSARTLRGETIIPTVLYRAHEAGRNAPNIVVFPQIFVISYVPRAQVLGT